MPETVVIHEEAVPTVNIVEEVTQTVEVQVAGLRGRPGSPGYDHTQASPATTWIIAHNLGLRPSVQTFSVGGVEIIGAVQHLSFNTLTVTFAVAVAGTARLV